MIATDGQVSIQVIHKQFYAHKYAERDHNELLQGMVAIWPKLAQEYHVQ